MALMDLFNPQTFAPGNEQMTLLQRLMPMLVQSGLLQQGSTGFSGQPSDVSAASAPPQMPQTIAPPQQPPQMPQGGPASMQPQSGLLGPWMKEASLPLMMLGAGIAGGKTWGEGIGKGLTGVAAVQSKSNEQQTKLKMQQQVYQMLVSQGVPPQKAMLAVMSPEAGKAAGVLGSGNEPEDLKLYNAAKAQGFKGTLMDFIASKRAGAGEYGTTPIWGVDAQGNPSIGQLGKSGKGTVSSFPVGFRPGKDAIKVDAGTSWILLDPVTRNKIGEIPKDIAGAKVQAEVGKGRGEAAASLESIRSKMPGLEKVVRELGELGEKATYTGVGQAFDYGRRQLGMDPREGSIARQQYVSMVDNQILPLLRDTFGAQFTQKEGESLKATLGNPNVSPKEKQAVLRSFIEQKRRDVEALETRVGVAPSAPAQTGPMDYRDYFK